MPAFLTEAVAQQIVQRAMTIIGHNVNVMDRTGIIIGTGSPQRLHQVHEGALRALEAGGPYDVTEVQAARMKGVQAGINRPVRFRREVVGVVGVTGEPSAVSHFADLVVMTAELMIENASVLSEIHWNQRQRDNIVSEMIHGEAETDDLFGVRSKKLGIDPLLPRVAIVVSFRTKAGNDLRLAEIEAVQQCLRQTRKDDLVALICPTQAVILHQVNTASPWHPDQLNGYLEQLLHSLEGFTELECRVALGRYVAGLNGIPMSYQSAQEALYLGSMLHPPQRLYRYFDYQLDSLLLEFSRNWKGLELQSQIAPLIKADARGTLIKTLRHFIEQHTDSGKTAQSLHIHRNTLSYRLERIHQLTGRNPRKFDDLLFLHSALRLWEIKNCATAQNTAVIP